jgi:hypothetical protein
MPASYYVYYRVRSGLETAARAGVGELLARLSRDTGVEGRLLTKRGEPALWMEVYEPVGATLAFERALQSHVEALRLEQYLVDGRRQVECFEPCA